MNESKIYVGNLPYRLSEEEIRTFFNQYGEIVELKLISDRATGRPKGFGFITFASNEEGKAALAANGQDLGGRPLIVNTARDNPARN